MTSAWYLNAQQPFTCSGQLQGFQVEPYSIQNKVTFSVMVAVWENNGTVDMYRKIVSCASTQYSAGHELQ